MSTNDFNDIMLRLDARLICCGYDPWMDEQYKKGISMEALATIVSGGSFDFLCSDFDRYRPVLQALLGPHGRTIYYMLKARNHDRR